MATGQEVGNFMMALISKDQEKSIKLVANIRIASWNVYPFYGPVVWDEGTCTINFVRQEPAGNLKIWAYNGAKLQAIKGLREDEM
jgi:hypothetical protein